MQHVQVDGHGADEGASVACAAVQRCKGCFLWTSMTFDRVEMD